MYKAHKRTEIKKKEVSKDSYMALGMTLGMSFGTSIGICFFVTFDNIIYLSMGMMFGMCAGMFIGLVVGMHKKNQNAKLEDTSNEKLEVNKN